MQELDTLLLATEARRQQPLPNGKFAPDVRFPDSAIADLAAGKSVGIRQGDLYLVPATKPWTKPLPDIVPAVFNRMSEAERLSWTQPVLMLAPDGSKDKPSNGYQAESLRELVYSACSARSSHRLRLEDLGGLLLYWPANWEVADFIGPYFRHDTREVVVEHSRHGNVTIPAGLGIQCVYQREYDSGKQTDRRVYD